MPSLFRGKAGEKNQRRDQRIIFRNFQQKTKGGSIIYEKLHFTFVYYSLHNLSYYFKKSYFFSDFAHSISLRSLEI